MDPFNVLRKQASLATEIQNPLIGIATVQLESNGCDAAKTLDFLVEACGEKETTAREAIQHALDNTSSREESLDDFLAPVETSPKIYPTSMLDWALWCVEKGWYVFPCLPGKKSPACNHGFKDATNDPEQVRAWFAQNPEFNYGVALGASNLVVADFDTAKPFVSDVPFANDVPTFTVQTGRNPKDGIAGIQKYYRGSCKTRNMYIDAAGNPTADEASKGVENRKIGEIRSRGAYVIGPGCLHPDGNLYCILSDGELAESPEQNEHISKPSGPAIGTDEQNEIAEYVEAALDDAGVVYNRRRNYKEEGNGFIWDVICPWDEVHSFHITEPTSSSVVIMESSGRLLYECKHRCLNVRQWKEFRAWMESKVGHKLPFGNKAPELPLYINGVLYGSPEYMERLAELSKMSTGSHDCLDAEENDSYESSFQNRLTELYHQGKTVEEIAEESGFNRLVAESLEKVAAETAKAEATKKEAETEVQTNWLSKFRGVTEMEEGDIVMVIDGVLQEGTCFIGANPGDGKTLIALAMAKAISSGTPLFNIAGFSVKEARPVIYLIPESRDRAFRKRCESFRITTDKMKFMARTISSGAPLELGDPYLIETIRQLKPVVFLDTATRFMKSNDENNAAQNRMLVNDVTSLLAAGAVCVVILHHATKASKNEAMDLQNMLRGTSDLAAMCDSTFGIRKDESLHNNGAGPLEIDIANLKDREMTGELTTLRLAASYKKDGIAFPVSYINETGNFQVMGEELIRRTTDTIIRMIDLEPNIPAKELASRLRTSEYQVKKTLASRGYHKVKGGPDGSSPWHQDKDKPCPYAKPTEADLLQDTIKWLKERITVGPTGESIQGLRESEILTRADMIGFKEKQLKQAAKRLGVKIDRETKVWSLPDKTPAGMIVE
jgi:hypothetical protein